MIVWRPFCLHQTMAFSLIHQVGRHFHHLDRWSPSKMIANHGSKRRDRREPAVLHQYASILCHRLLWPEVSAKPSVVQIRWFRRMQYWIEILQCFERLIESTLSATKKTSKVIKLSPPPRRQKNHQMHENCVVCWVLVKLWKHFYVQSNKKTNSNHLIVIPLLRAPNTAVERGWWFICTSDLNLHEVSFVEIALRTSCCSSIHILPRIFTSQNIIRLLSLNFSMRSVRSLKSVKIWTAWAAKSHSIHIFFQKQQVSAHGTEMHFSLQSPFHEIEKEKPQISTVP